MDLVVRTCESKGLGIVVSIPMGLGRNLTGGSGNASQ